MTRKKALDEVDLSKDTVIRKFEIPKLADIPGNDAVISATAEKIARVYGANRQILPGSPPDPVSAGQDLAAAGRGRGTVIKLPTRYAAMLDAIAADRGGFRSTIASTILEAELPPLAKAHRDGLRPALTPVEPGAGHDRRSLSIKLSAAAAAALDEIATLRGAVKHQVLLRVLLPGIERVHLAEIEGR